MDEDKDLHIRTRAYSIWESEGRPDGRHDEHWKRAAEEFHGVEDLPAATPGEEAAKAAVTKIDTKPST